MLGLICWTSTELIQPWFIDCNDAWSLITIDRMVSIIVGERFLNSDAFRFNEQHREDETLHLVFQSSPEIIRSPSNSKTGTWFATFIKRVAMLFKIEANTDTLSLELKWAKQIERWIFGDHLPMRDEPL